MSAHEKQRAISSLPASEGCPGHRVDNLDARALGKQKQEAAAIFICTRIVLAAMGEKARGQANV